MGGTATVQAGVTCRRCRRRRGRRAGCSRSIWARGARTIGGNVATNAGGASMLRYGMMRALVLRAGGGAGRRHGARA